MSITEGDRRRSKKPATFRHAPFAYKAAQETSTVVVASMAEKTFTYAVDEEEEVHSFQENSVETDRVTKG